MSPDQQELVNILGQLIASGAAGAAVISAAKQLLAKIKGGKKEMPNEAKEEKVEEGNNPFDYKNYTSQIPKKPGETAGFDSKKVSTGTVYTRKPSDEKEKEKPKGVKPKMEEVEVVDEGLGRLVSKIINKTTKPSKTPLPQKSDRREFETPGNGSNVKPPVNEAAEEINELKKATVKSYIKKKMNNLSGKNPKKDQESLMRSHHRVTGVKPTSEEVEQIDEISKETAGKYLTAPQGKGANKYKVSSDKSVYPNIETMSKHSTNVRRALKRSEGSSLYKKPDYYKEEVELDERTLTSGESKKKEEYVKGMKKGLSGFKQRYGERAKSVMYATATKMAKKD